MREDRLKTWLISIGAALAALALFATNIDNILTISAKWLGPYLAQYISPQARIAIQLDDAVATMAVVFIADPANEAHALAVGETRHGQEVQLTVPANTLYKIGWQGPNIEAGAVTGILAKQGASAFRLLRTGEKEGIIQITLRPRDMDSAPLAATEPSAALLISSRAVGAISEPATIISSGALPELDRAVTIVGLFETGTTDCARRVFYTPSFRGRDTKVPSVGCLAISIPGWLTDVINAVDNGDAHRLDAILGDDAPAIRTYAKEHVVPTEEQIQRATRNLIAAPEFWIAYQSRVLMAYARAADVARQIGLVSERGRLLIFDRLVNSGPSVVARGVQTYTDSYPATAQDRPETEQARIGALGDIFKRNTTIPASVRISATVARRIDTIVSGQGSIRGIFFDLTQLGISDAN